MAPAAAKKVIMPDWKPRCRSPWNISGSRKGMAPTPSGIAAAHHARPEGLDAQQAETEDRIGAGAAWGSKAARQHPPITREGPARSRATCRGR